MKRSVLDHWLADIEAHLTECPVRDIITPDLAPGALNHLLTEVAKLAAGEPCADPEDWAADLLYEVWTQVSCGTPFGEPRELPWEIVLSPGPDGGDWG